MNKKEIRPTYVVDSFSKEDLLPHMRDYHVWYIDGKLLYWDRVMNLFKARFVNEEEIDEATIVKLLTPIYKYKSELRARYADYLLTTDTSEQCLIKPYHSYYVQSSNYVYGSTVEERIANALMNGASFVLYYKNDELYYYFMYNSCIYYCSATENPERLADMI